MELLFTRWRPIFLVEFFRNIFWKIFIGFLCSKKLSNFSSRRCVWFAPKIVQIRAILSIFRPFEDFRFLPASTGIGVNGYRVAPLGSEFLFRTVCSIQKQTHTQSTFYRRLDRTLDRAVDRTFDRTPMEHWIGGCIKHSIGGLIEHPCHRSPD